MMRSNDENRSVRVLVVEDEPVIALDLESRLKKLGHVVIGVVDNGPDAIELAHRERAELILMDIRIQGPIDGIDTAKELGLLMDVPIIFLTGHGDAATVERARQVKPYGYMLKPFEVPETSVPSKLETIIQMAIARHDAEAEARLLLQAVKQAAVGIGIANAQEPGLPFVLCNPALEDISGYTRDEILERSPSFLEGPTTDRTLSANLSDALQDQRAHSVVLNAHRKDGQQFWLEMSISPVKDLAGTASHCIVFYRDVTTAKGTEFSLAQAHKMEALGKLTGGLAHDFNNILAVITSFAGLASMGLPDDDPRREDLDSILAAAQRGSGLTRQILSFSQQQPTLDQPTDISLAMMDVRPLIERSLTDSIRLDLVPSESPAIAELDSIQLNQVLVSLAQNAREAMSDGGVFCVAISCHSAPVADLPAGPKVRLTVTDTGDGMPAEVLERALEPFYTTKAAGTGTGLGLATCFTIIRGAGGRMTLDSRLGEGTCVTIDLPASPTDTWPTETIVSAKDTVLGTKVLVAEDNEQLLLATARILSDAGYDVAIAKDGAEAKAQIDKTEFALMFSDVVMPQPDGYTLVEYTREHSPKTRVLLTSGHTNGRNHSPGMEKVPLLWKPYTREELLATVSRALLSEPTSNTPPAKAVDVLPVPAPAAASAPAATEPDPTAPGQILLIEDDALMQAATKRVLTRAGYEVEVVDNAVDAKTALDSESGYVAVLCDLGLPGGAGPALLDWLLESHPALARRTLVVTGGATNPVGAALIQSGAYEVVLKPVRPAQLLERVVAICDTVAESSGTVTEATSLPLIETPPLVETTPHSKSTQLSATVLIVDDEEDLLRAYGRSLQTAGFTVTLARSAEEALQRLRAATFDAVATDIGLPGVDGLTLMRQIREIDPDLPVLLITGAPTVATATLAVEHNAICYLSKPFLPQELIDQVIRAVKAGQVVRLQRQLLAARSGADEFLADLPRTLERFEAALSQLYMVYQPIIRAHDSSVFGYEALLRSTEPSFSSPLEVVGAAEALGRVEDLGLRVRGEVGKMIADHPDHNELIFVNLHPSELRSELLCATTEPVLSNATRIVLEVTERTSLSLGPELSEDIGTLRNRGYRVAIDDLGEGYAGLSWLANLNPDIAKIDMSLVRDVHRLPLKRKIVGSLIEVCRGAGITSLGEGVETIEEANVLTELGCELLQGYYFGKPAKAFRQKSQGGL